MSSEMRSRIRKKWVPESGVKWWAESGAEWGVKEGGDKE